MRWRIRTSIKQGPTKNKVLRPLEFSTWKRWPLTTFKLLLIGGEDALHLCTTRTSFCVLQKSYLVRLLAAAAAERSCAPRPAAFTTQFPSSSSSPSAERNTASWWAAASFARDIFVRQGWTGWTSSQICKVNSCLSWYFAEETSTG